MDTFLKIIFILAVLITGAFLAINAYQFGQEVVNIRYIPDSCKQEECDCNIDELCDFPVYDDECLCESCDCMSCDDCQKTELEQLQAEYDQLFKYTKPLMQSACYRNTQRPFCYYIK